MNGRRNKALNESTGLRSVPAMTGAETVAIGTAAGALMLGVLQADAAPKEAVRPTGTATTVSSQDGQMQPSGDAAPNIQNAAGLPARDPEIAADAAASRPPGAGSQAAPAAAKPHASEEHAQAAHEQVAQGHAAAAAAPSGDHGQTAEAPAAHAGGAGSDAHMPISPSPVVHAMDVDSIAARIADQVTAAIGQISHDIHQGIAPEAIGQSIAREISTAVAGIAKDIETSLAGLPQLDGLAGSVQAQVNDVLGQMPDVDAVLSVTTAPVLPGLDAADPLDAAVAQVASLLQSGPAQGTSSLSTPVEAIPATILGAEIEDTAPTGLLSQIFYDDGKSDAASGAQAAADHIANAVALPEPAAIAADPGEASPPSEMLSEAAFVMDDSGATQGMDFAGLSYVDAHDHGYEGMLSTPNALHVL